MTIARRTFANTRDLYAGIMKSYKPAFLTNYRDSHGNISQQPASWTVVRKYISFLRAIQVVDEEEIRLSPRGLELFEDAPSGYNGRLLRLIDRWLKNHGLDRDQLRNAMQRVMQRRTLPTRSNVLNELALMRKMPVNEQHLTLALDSLGYIGMIGILRRRDQVYFPWTAQARLRGRAI